MKQEETIFRYQTKEEYDKEFEYLFARINEEYEIIKKNTNEINRREEKNDREWEKFNNRKKKMTVILITEIIMAILIIISMIAIPNMLIPLLTIFGIGQPLGFFYTLNLLNKMLPFLTNKQSDIERMKLLYETKDKLEVTIKVLEKKLEELVIEMNQFSIAQNESLEQSQEVLNDSNQKEVCLTKKLK